MDVFPHSKINLSLYITGRWPDGYHNVDTIYWPLALFDFLRLERAEAVSLSSPEKALESPDNLVIRAWQLMREQYGVPPLKMYLEKGIPWEAGLGGGSGDAGAVLLACNRLFRLGLTRKKLCEIGGRLGADVPACMLDTPSRGRGTGARLDYLKTNLSLPLLILKPPQGFSTPAMYKAWDVREEGTADPRKVEKAQKGMIRALEGEDPMAIIPFLHNDFEQVLSGAERSVLEQAREILARAGAAGSLLCGSGSAVFGLWAGEEARQEARERLLGALPEGWRLLVPFPSLKMM